MSPQPVKSSAAVEPDARRAGSPVSAGRPRDPSVERRLVCAVLELLPEVGYSGTTIESVAKRAAVSRPTIYRRWASRAEMVEFALFGVSQSAALPVTTNLRRDVIVWVDGAVERLSRPAVAAALPGLIAESGRASNARDLLAVRREHFAELVREGKKRGDMRRSVDSDVVFDMMIGAIFLRVSSGISMDRPFSRQLAQTVVAALEARPPQEFASH